MPDKVHLDFETAADADLTKVGLDVYSSPQSNPRVLMASYRINNEKLQHWEAHKSKFPSDLRDALLDPECERWAFNAQFERTIARRVLKIATPRRRWRCAMVLAYMESFMGGLADVADQIGLPLDKQKMKDGKRLIRKFCMPQRLTKNQPNEWRNWITDPGEWELFGQYNDQDVISEEAVVQRLIRFPIPADEWENYELDQRINDRGMPVDPDFVSNVIWMAARRKAELLAQMQEITGADNPNSTQQLLPWLQAEGYPYSDLQSESVGKALKLSPDLWDCPKDVPDDEAPDAVRVLRLRQWAARTSVSKAVTAQRVVGSDGRARFLYQFCGAGRTGRVAGREIQPTNMMRTPKVLDAEESDEKLSYVTDLIRAGDYDGFDLLFKERMLAFTGCMRSLFRAPDGEKLMAMDYSSIESVGLGWVTNCERLLEVFRSGRDAYKDFGTMFYQKSYDEITRVERQICKPPTLGCGYRLSAGTDKDGVKTGLLAYAENMGVEMTLEEAQRAVTVFREGYPEVPQFWYDCEKAVRHVLQTHKPYELGPVLFDWMKPYLLIRLPSGRCIYYYKPRMEKRTVYTGRMVRKRVKSRGYFEDGAPPGQWITTEEEETYTRNSFTYMGRNQKTTRWDRIDGHGGPTTENIVQALTRDIEMVGLRRLHKAGFNLIGHAYDEGVALVKDGDNYHTLERMREVWIEPIDWAPDFPLNAAGWQGSFYRK